MYFPVIASGATAMSSCILNDARGLLCTQERGLQFYRPINSAGTALIGHFFCDMSGVQNPQTKQTIRNLASALYKITDYVDDLLDNAQYSRTNAVSIMQLCFENMFDGSAHTAPESKINSALLCGQEIHKLLSKASRPELLREILINLMKLVQSEPELNTQELRLQRAKDIGAQCVDMAASLPEVFTGKTINGLRDAGRKLGEFAELLDCYCDLNEDLATGSNTFATAYIREHGDEAISRSRVRRLLLKEALHSYYEGRVIINYSALTDNATASYALLGRLLSFKYRSVFKKIL